MNEEITPPAQAIINTKSLANQMVDISKVYLNVSQEVIITTEDKVRLCLSEYIKRIEKKRGWIAPLGILVAIILTFVTSTFDKTFGLEAALWKAFFIFGGLLSFGWLIFSIIQACRSKKIEDIVVELKRGLPVKIESSNNHRGYWPKTS